MESKMIKSFKDFKINEDTLNDELVGRLLASNKQIEWLNRYTQGTWKFNSKRQVDITGSFNCSGQNLTDFLGIEFGKVTSSFRCDNNLRLTSLKGAPITVGYEFYCYKTGITSLEGAPVKVGYDFYCDKCPNLVTLRGTLEEVSGELFCYDNPKLASLMGAPYKVGNYVIYKCPLLPKNETYIDELELTNQWLESKLSAEDFLEKKKGTIRGRKYGI
jgi:hypothetical protein